MKTSIRIMFTHQIKYQGSDHNMVKEFACFKSFYNFHYIIMATLCQKISKNLKNRKSEMNDTKEFPLASSRCTPFFLQTLFSWKISQNSFEKSKNSHYLAANLHPPLESLPNFFSLSPSSSPIQDQEDRFEPINFN